MWKVVSASTAYVFLGGGVSVDLGAEGTVILVDSGYLAEDPTQLALAIQNRFTSVPLTACKVLSLGPGYGVPTARSLPPPPYNQSTVV